MHIWSNNSSKSNFDKNSVRVPSNSTNSKFKQTVENPYGVYLMMPGESEKYPDGNFNKYTPQGLSIVCLNFEFVEFDETLFLSKIDLKELIVVDS